MKRSALTFVLAAGALAGVLAAVVMLGNSGGPTVNSGKALIGGPFSLTDHTGKRVTEKDFASTKKLVFFGFTSCPDICPTGLQTIASALDQLGEKSSRIATLFITIDPARDTPEKLAEYVKSFHPRISGLTGSPEEIAAVAKAYRVYFQKVADEKNPGDYTVDHSAFLYLMDENGQYIRHFAHSVDPGTLAAELAKSL